MIGLALGFLFRFTRDSRLTAPVMFGSVLMIIAACAVGILGVKSAVEWLLYSQPLVIRIGKNIYAFWADAFVLAFSLPVCRILDDKIRKYI